MGLLVAGRKIEFQISLFKVVGDMPTTDSNRKLLAYWTSELAVVHL